MPWITSPARSSTSGLRRPGGRAGVAHEDLTRDTVPVGASDRRFGSVFTGFWLLVGLWPLRRGHPIRIWALLLAVAFLTLALGWPRLLSPLNRLWFRLGLLLHRVTNPLVMSVMFFGVITPMGLAMRLLGWDFLRLRKEPHRQSYWIDRRPPGPLPKTMRDQF
jgi:hypothetical protein